MRETYKDRVKKTKKLSVFLEHMESDEHFGAICADIEKYRAAEEECEERVFQNQDVLLIAGYPAVLGCCLLAQYYEEELKKQFPMHFIRQIQELKEMAVQNHEKLNARRKDIPGICYLLGEGGLRKAIYQLGKESEKGFTIDYGAVPVRQESIEICEFYDCDPWEMFSGGSMLIATDQPRKVQRLMEEENIVCQRVGYLTEQREKLIRIGEQKSGINRPLPDAMLKILQKKLGEV